jgi:hypothetical protein
VEEPHGARALWDPRRRATVPDRARGARPANPRGFRVVFSSSLHGGGWREIRIVDVDKMSHLARVTAWPVPPAAVDLAGAGITAARVSDRIFGAPEPDVTSANAAAYGPELPAHTGRWLLLE